MKTPYCSTSRSKITYAFCLSVLTVVLASCVTPFQLETQQMAPALVVDGLLTDQPGPHVVRLSRTADYTNAALNLLVGGATVTLTDNLGNRQTLAETSFGTYTTPTAYKGITGRSYRLAIQTRDGKRYESDPEELRAAVPIKNLYYEYRREATAISNADIYGWDVYADVEDSAEPGDFYRWSWVHYNYIFTCRTVEAPTGVFADFACCGNCWDIVRCNGCININSDALINGNTLSRQFVLRVPYTSTLNYYVEVEQQHISRGAYQFLKSASQLRQSTGGLFDPAPATLRGNIRSVTNPGELVLGFFGTAGVTVQPLLVRRTGVPALPPSQRPPDYGMPPRPCVACENNLSRTPIKPRWWEF